MTTATEDHPAASVDPFADFWLPDYCPECNPLGHNADRCTRRTTETEPDAVTWHGGKAVVCEYNCDRCGHTWTRSDLWDAQCAGFFPTPRRAA